MKSNTIAYKHGPVVWFGPKMLGFVSLYPTWAHYQELVVSFIKQYGQASRQDIDNLLVDKFPDVLSDKQKFNKINRLLSSIMANKLKFIKTDHADSPYGC